MTSILDPATLGEAPDALARLAPDVRVQYSLEYVNGSTYMLLLTFVALTPRGFEGHALRCHCPDTSDCVGQAAREVFERPGAFAMALRVIDVWDDQEHAWWRFLRSGMRSIPDSRDRATMVETLATREVEVNDYLDSRLEDALVEYDAMTDDELLEVYLDVTDDDDELHRKYASTASTAPAGPVDIAPEEP